MNFLRRDFVIREPLLVGVLVLIAVVFSTVTHAYSQAYDRRRNQLGQEWFDRGNRELRNSLPAAAVEEFRTALLYDPQNWNYRLRLAEALTLAGHTNQALNYYQGLWQVNPRNGLVNLHLARFAAESGHAAEAERYFNGAIFGDWPESAAGHRRESLLELINFYLERKNAGQAESQLIILAGNLPEDPVLHSRVGDLYAQVGDYRRALGQYRVAFELNPNYLPALYGAGKTSFHMGDYQSAEAYLSRAAHEDSAGPDVGKLLETAQSAASLNPFERGLHESEKIQRVLRLFEIASARLNACLNASAAHAPSLEPLATLQEQLKQWKLHATAPFLAGQPDQIDPLF